MNEYRDIHASLLRFCSDFAEEIGGLEVVYLDAFTDAQDLPSGDFVGLTSLQIDLDSPLRGQAGIVISTVNDTNLFRLVDLVNRMANKLGPAHRLKVYNAGSGRVTSQLSVLAGTRIAPPVETERNPMQPIYFSFQAA